MRRRIIIGSILIALLGGMAAASLAQQKAEKDVEAVVTRFWQAVEQGDLEGVKATTHAPVMLVEIEPETDEGTANVFDPNDPGEDKLEAGEMVVRPRDLKVGMRGPGLAYVVYEATTPGDDTVYPMVTMVTREGGVWRIVSTSIPM